jgi:uncharacterized protein DUF1616
LKRIIPAPSFGSILTELRTGRFETVGQLWEWFHNQNPTVGFDVFRSQLNQLQAAGIVELEEPRPSNFSGFIRSSRHGLRLWGFVTGTLLAVSIVELSGITYPWVLAQWVAGTFLVLFAPGYAVTWALFPSKQQLSDLSRFALTVALSIFIVPVIGLLFNYTSVGIRPAPIALVIATLTEVSLFAGAYREFTVLQAGR